MLISGLGLGDAIFYSKPMKLFNIEIPKSLVYILFCHLVLMVVCWIVYAKLCIGQWTLTKVIWMLSFIITLITIGSDVNSHLRVFSFILLYVRWTILQLELPNMVPVNVRGFIFCLGKFFITKKNTYSCTLEHQYLLPFLEPSPLTSMCMTEPNHPWAGEDLS